MRRKDRERLFEIAADANVGDEAKAGKQTGRTWKAYCWATSEAWRAAAEKDEDRRVILEQIKEALGNALQGFQLLKAHRDAPAAAPETSPAAVESAAAAPAIAAPAVEAPKAEAPKSADEDGPLVPKKIDEQIELLGEVAKSGVIA